MVLKLHALVCDLAQLRQRKNLVTAAVGQDRPVPHHEIMKAAKMFDYLEPGPNKQMISVSENDWSVQFAQLARTHRFNTSLGSDWHERRRLDCAMRGR